MALVVTGMGALTSLANGVIPSAAAFRAGLVRPQDVPVHALDEDDASGAAPVQGHPVAAELDGFFQFGLWRQMLSWSLRDLLRNDLMQIKRPMEALKTQVIIPLPIWDEDRFTYEFEADYLGITDAMVAPALREIQLPIPHEQFRYPGFGHVAWIRGLEASMALADKAQLLDVLLLSADNYVDECSLQWLSQNNRLKNPAAPAGLMPGQASVSLLLTATGIGQLHESQPLGQIFRATSIGPVEGILGKEREIAKNLATCVEQLWGGASCAFPGMLYVDLNGEGWRGKVFGYFQVLSQKILDWTKIQVFSPAESFGETGIASGPLALCLALRSFARKYAHYPYAMILSVGDDGSTGGVLAKSSESSA
jgi:3-oxoacyl-[acyl-carrier-protein] synthase I